MPNVIYRQSELGSPGRDKGIFPRSKRVFALMVLVVSAVAAIVFAQLTGFGNTHSSGEAGHVAEAFSEAALQTPEARRLMRLLMSVQGSKGADVTTDTNQNGDVASTSLSEQEHSTTMLLTTLGEKNLKCETALTQCKTDLLLQDTDSKSLTDGNTQKEKEQLIEKLLQEVKVLKEELEKLRRTKPASDRIVLTKAEGEPKEASLEADNLGLAAEMISLSSPTTPETQIIHISPAKPLPVSCEGIPKFGKEAETAALEAARKVLEECGAKEGVPGADSVNNNKGYACEATEGELKQYFNYTPRAQCPDDWYFVQKLVYTKNCFCLPKRRCFSPSPPNYREPTIPFPQSLFDPNTLQNDNVRWEKMYWPSYESLNSRTLGDCRDCFNLTLENSRWQVNFMGTIPIEQMLSLKGRGSIKIGLDAGGGTGSFAAKMAERGVTIVTTAMNTETLGGDREGGLPYMETIAQRGLIPLFVPHKVRQPFFDGTLDIVHNINSIKYFSIPEFEELLFEWDRILRPGGVMWFELFYAPVAEMPLYVSVIEMFGYKKLYWNMTPKVDAAERNDVPHVYLNCVLEKPRRPNNAPPLKPGMAKQ